jgi:hypothetical protein
MPALDTCVWRPGADSVTRFRRNLLLAGLGGLLTCGLSAVVATWFVLAWDYRPLLSYPVVTLLLGLIFGGFSVAEIPIMVLVLRRLTVERPNNHGLVWGLNAVYVFFAAVYGVPVLLLTGAVGWGLALCGLGLLRFLTSSVFVQEHLP